MTVEILVGDAVARLREMRTGSVHCVVTSPPYHGLRDYGTGAWEGGDPACQHLESKPARTANSVASSGLEGGKGNTHRSHTFGNACGHCGARWVDQQIGLEESPEAWCARLVEVFREVRRVLRHDGTLWLNCGDSYAANGRSGLNDGFRERDNLARGRGVDAKIAERVREKTVPLGLKPKDLIGQPWLLAFALRADGWWLRSEIIWSKPNPMPESVRDRPTKAHEQIFLLTKSANYYFDQEAVREANQDTWQNKTVLEHHGGTKFGMDAPKTATGDARQRFAVRFSNPAGRNSRSVWTIATEPYGEAHFATFPSELARRCILAGTSAKGCCPECGAPWARVVGDPVVVDGRESGNKTRNSRPEAYNGRYGVGRGFPWQPTETQTTGWCPTCICTVRSRPCGESVTALPVPCTVLDCFGGAGTTGLAADQLGRDAILIELSPEYAQMARKRIDGARARRLIGDTANAPRTLPGQQEMAL